MKLEAEVTTNFGLFEKGDKVWFQPSTGYYIPGEIIEVNFQNKTTTVQSVIDQKETFIVSNISYLTKRKASSVQNVEDLVQLDELSDPAILWALKCRYDRNRIYTYMGNILISINPYQMHDIYNVDYVKKYRHQAIGSLPAHIFAYADSIYNDMLVDKADHYVVLCGESGSGKTECHKLLMQYLSLITPPDQPRTEPAPRDVLAEQIFDSQTILESFGNAKTILNDNASRYGKCTNIQFRDSRINGAEINDFLLEKYRIIYQRSGERNFHIFYELLSGLKQDLREKFGLNGPEKYFYLNQGKCTNVPERSDYESFSKLQQSLDLLEFSSDQQHSIFRILASILHIGNVYFNKQIVMGQTDGVLVGNDSEVQWVSYLLHIDPEELTQSLTMKITENRGEKLKTSLNIDRALDMRDAIAKMLYTHLFNWILAHINRILGKSDSQNEICLIDFYGFEQLNNNSFEQLCVNYANERLQNFFYQCVFRIEQQEYAKEKIEWTSDIGRSSSDNQPILDILTKRSYGIFHLLDDECCFPKGTDESFLLKCHYNHIDNPLYSKSKSHEPEFCIRHFGGPVWYEVPGFLEKNRDTVKGQVTNLFKDNQNPVIAQMFKARSATVSLPIENDGKAQKSATVSSSFILSMNMLIQKLSKNKAHFIRCIKPNQDKIPSNFDLRFVSEQIRRLGFLDTVKLRRVGYPVKYVTKDFTFRYRILLPKENFADKSDVESTQFILSKLAAHYCEQYQIGTTKVFLKPILFDYLEKLRERKLHRAAIVIQKNLNAFLKRRSYLRKRKSAVKLQAAFRGWRARKYFALMKRDLFRDVQKQAKHSSQLQMYENMLTASASSGEKISRNHAITIVNHLELPADLKISLNSMHEWDLKNRKEKVVRTASDFLPCERHCTLPLDLHNYSFVKYAQTYFKGHLWQMRREPITTPFLLKNDDSDFKESLLIFKLILRYMNSIGLTITQEALLANYIIQKGIVNSNLRDEIYVQLVNQTYCNPNPANQERGWWLVALCASAFPLSSELYKFLLNYITFADCEGYRPELQKRLLHCFQREYGPYRRYPPCMLEHRSIQLKAKMALSALLPDGYNRLCQLDAWTTANEFAAMILKQKGIHDARGWAASFDSSEVEIQLNGGDFLLDVLSYYELPRDFQALKSEFLLWPKPMTSEKREAQLRRLADLSTNGILTPSETTTTRNGNANGLATEITAPHSKSSSGFYRPLGSSLSGELLAPTAQQMASPSVSIRNGFDKQERVIPIVKQQPTENNRIPQAVQPNFQKSQIVHSPPQTQSQALHQVLCQKHSTELTIPKTKTPEPKSIVPDFSAVRHLKQSDCSIVTQRLPNEVPEAVMPRGSIMGDSCSTYYQDSVYMQNVKLPSEYSTRSIASHVKNVAIPSKNSDVDKFLDDLFEPVLYSNGTTIEDLYEANSLAASIKGIGDMTNGSSNGIVTQASNNQPNASTFSLIPAMNQPVLMMMPMDAMKVFGMQNIQGISNFSGMQMPAFTYPTFNSNSMLQLPNLACNNGNVLSNGMSVFPMQFPNMFPQVTMVNGQTSMISGQSALISSQQETTKNDVSTVAATNAENESSKKDDGASNNAGHMGTLPPAPAFPKPMPESDQKREITDYQFNQQQMQKMNNGEANGYSNQTNSYNNGEAIYDRACNLEEEYARERRGARMFMRGPPTTITEETDDFDAESLDDKNPSYLVGTMKPTTDAARWAPSVISKSDRSNNDCIYNGKDSIYSMESDYGTNNRSVGKENGVQTNSINRQTVEQRYSSQTNGESDVRRQNGPLKDNLTYSTVSKPAPAPVVPKPPQPVEPQNWASFDSRIDERSMSLKEKTARDANYERTPPRMINNRQIREPRDRPCDPSANRMQQKRNQQACKEDYFPTQNGKADDRKMPLMDQRHSAMSNYSSSLQFKGKNDGLRSFEEESYNERGQSRLSSALGSDSQNQFAESYANFKENYPYANDGAKNFISADQQDDLNSNFDIPMNDSNKQKMMTLQQLNVRFKDQSFDRSSEWDDLSYKDKEEQRLQDEFRNARPSSRNREIHDENVTLTRSQFSSRKAQNQTALNGDQAADDWVQEDVQLPPYRENMYYFEGRSVPMTESYLHQPVRPLNCDMGLFKGSKGDLSMRDNVSLISAKENQENLEKNQLQKLSKRASGNTQRPNLPYVLMKKSNKKKLSVLTYENAPWRLKIRKELFYPNESLDEEELMNLLFYQIISDCKEPNPFRIRPKDRDMVANHLRSYDVNFTSMQNEKITNGLKKSVIDIARSWPLYFCKMFPIVEDRESEFLAQLLGLSENGIFLLYRNVSNSDEPLKILDRFGFDDLDKSEVFSNNLLVLTTVTGICVRIFTPKAEIIKNLIDEFLFGPNQGKQFVRAISDYITKEPNLLNFNKGDIIQLLPNMQDNQLDSGWLYGKLNNKFGNFPAEYVEPLHGNNSNLPPHLLNNDIGEANGLEMDFDAFLMADGAPGNTAMLGFQKGKFTMMEFAMLYYRQTQTKFDIVKTDDKTGNTLKVPGKKSKKEWTWKEVADTVKYSKTPIQASLLKLETSELSKLAVETFICVMIYMGDYPLKKDQSVVDSVYKLLNLSEKHPPLRDEVYCQLMKQTTNNKSTKPDSAVLGWRLFSIFTAYFECSEVLKPYLLKYLTDAANDTRRAYHGTAMISVLNLKQTFKYGGRKNLLSYREIESITNGKNLKRQIYHLPGGTKKVINTKSVSVVEEIIQELCQELNIRSPLEQQEFCLCYVVESENTMKLLSNDDYILDVTTDLEYRRKDYFLLLKRTVWIHPLRLDNELYIDVTFFQVVPDYLEGLLVIMKSPETISAQFMDDIARLGALLHSADEHWDGQPVNSRTVVQALPRIVQNLRHVTFEQWADRVNSKLRQLPANINTTQARAKFLDILQSSWPLFGSTFFYVSHVSDAKVQDECLLAINKHGIQFLHIITHETLLEFRLNEILSTHKVTAGHPMGGPPVQFLDIKVGNLLQQRVISLQTEQGAEISRLLGQYIYVDSQNRGFLQGDGANNVL